MIDAVALVGPVARVRDRLQAFAAAGVTTLIAKTRDVDTIGSLAEAAQGAT